MNKNKIKGSNFERHVAEVLTALIPNSEWKRVPGSGALGTTLGESTLVGDVKGKVENFPFLFRGECKTGYNHSEGKEVKQITLKKEWFDKIREEAEQTNSVPLFFGKFEGARSGIKIFVAMDISVFADLINEYTDLKTDFDKIFIALQEAEPRKR